MYAYLFQLDSTVSYSEQYYDLPHDIVSFKFAPRSHAPPSIFFARFASTLFPGGGFQFGDKSFSIIHDFRSRLQVSVTSHF